MMMISDVVVRDLGGIWTGSGLSTLSQIIHEGGEVQHGKLINVERMNEGIHLDLDTWIVPGQIRKASSLMLIFVNCY